MWQEVRLVGIEELESLRHEFLFNHVQEQADKYWKQNSIQFRLDLVKTLINEEFELLEAISIVGWRISLVHAAIDCILLGILPFA